MVPSEFSAKVISGLIGRAGGEGASVSTVVVSSVSVAVVASVVVVSWVEEVVSVVDAPSLVVSSVVALSAASVVSSALLFQKRKIQNTCSKQLKRDQFDIFLQYIQK